MEVFLATEEVVEMSSKTKKIRTLAVGGLVAEDLDRDGYSYRVPKPFDIPYREPILVTHESFESPMSAIFVFFGNRPVLITD